MTGVLMNKTVVEIASGKSFSVILTSDSKLMSWGTNYAGELGDNSSSTRNVPVAVDMTGVLKNKNITRISCGFSHTLVLTSDNKLFGW
jgi:alpha-tubulin suppressor-like RCC1 family protein